MLLEAGVISSGLRTEDWKSLVWLGLQVRGRMKLLVEELLSSDPVLTRDRFPGLVLLLLFLLLLGLVAAGLRIEILR